MAAMNSSVANVIQLEGVLACENSKSHWSFQEAEVLRSQLMAHRAIDLRNQTAGIALRAFYNLALAEASLEPLESALTELESAVVDIEKLEESGFPSPVDSRDLRQRRLELLSQQAEVEATIVKLGEQVAVALALNPCCRTSISPTIDWTIDPQPIDACVAVEQGLAGRADLAQMRMVMQSLSSDTLPAAQAALQAVEGGLGQLDKRLRLLQMIMPGPSAEVEVPIRRSQVNRVLSDQQRLIAAQIRSAISEMDSRSRRTAIARRTLELRLEQLTDIRAKINAEQANAFEEVEAKLNVYKAQGELVAEIIGWKIANVNLREAQGLLATECGYCAETSCNCSH